MEGFTCLFRKDTDFHVRRYWLFTNPCIESYMPIVISRAWDTYTVGSCLEAFMVAGGSMRGDNLSNKKHILFLKSAVRTQINTKLSE